jgi:probable F420-dependent oxidoreductase
LAAAASVTNSIRLGPYVANAGLRDPLDLATEIATLDVVSDGRAVLGLGAGHTPQEWTMRSLDRPSPSARVDRLVACVGATRSLLAGEVVSCDGHVRLSDAVLAETLVRPDIPLLVGGNNRRLLSYAAQHADIVGLTGLGRTLAGGHLHEARWGPDELQESFELAGGAPERPVRPAIQVLVQWAEVTNDPDAVARRISLDLRVSLENVLSAPFVLIGSVEQIVERIHYNTDRWGIDSYVVRDQAIGDIGKVIAAMQ